MSDSLPLPPPVPLPEPKLIPMLLMRCGLESPECIAKKGVVVRMEMTTTCKDLFDSLKKLGFYLVTPRSNGHIHATIPLDDFLPDRPVLITMLCGACLRVAKANSMIDGEI